MSENRDKRRLIYSIVQFLNRELASENTHSDDSKESLEVANQCLQTAFCLSPEDTHLEVNSTLEEIFQKATAQEPIRKKQSPGPEDKEKAEKIKGEGNQLMKDENFVDAITKYTEAIELDPSNQVFYCNRAAAHSKMNNHYAAVEDCKRAIDMDPNYGKAYGRMGLAYSSVEKHKEAVDCFKRALELEPENEGYKSNLAVAQEKLETQGSRGPMPQGFPAGLGGLGGGPGGLDINNLLGNPTLMNMATSMLSDPNMQAMMGQMMSGGGMGGEGGPAGGGQNMEGLLQAGQRLAEQMQQSNPELVDQLRRQMGGGPPGAPGSGGNQEPGPGTS